MEIEKLVNFLNDKVNHHESCFEQYEGKDDIDSKISLSYHKGSVNAYKRVIQEFNLQTLF